ncbi:MAG TPA: hypothetical protein VGD39_03425 [Nocardioides sp.]
MASGVVAAPLAAQHATESVGFDDYLGAVPVRVSLTHNGVSTLDTGVLGRLYWDRTGAYGFGALLRVTGPPEAAGPSLAAYVDPAFLKTSTAFVDDPSTVAASYGAELRERVLFELVRVDVLAALAGGVVLTLALRGRPPLAQVPWPRRSLTCVVVLVAATLASGAAAARLFDQWDGSVPPEDAYDMPDVPGLSFSSPQAREIAVQVRPFVEKNTRRIEERSDAYASAVQASLREALDATSDDLLPRTGERIVLAEADTQGSFVGQRARALVYAALAEELGEDVFAVRTISGDVTSNGTVAEDSYVRAEASTTPGIPTVAVKGDHDTDTTVDQMDAAGILDPHLDPTEVGGLRVVAGNDPAFKTLFGGTVVNTSGATEADIGTAVRERVDEEDDGAGTIVLLHQPVSAAAYLGVDSLDDIDAADPTDPSTLQTPRDDGIPDVPPGIVNVGHLHDAMPPRIIWNTDTDQVTWTVVNQLGTAGGVEENPTFNRFSTPFSTPLKDLSVQLQYVDVETGLQTGYADLTVSPNGEVTLATRTGIGTLVAGG